jgi:hypothetical protein
MKNQSISFYIKYDGNFHQINVEKNFAKEIWLDQIIDAITQKIGTRNYYLLSYIDFVKKNTENFRLSYKQINEISAYSVPFAIIKKESQDSFETDIDFNVVKL